jgi:NAD(P)-dependent dehydrogenase (short-subunit alcohol dehydrogenase family)
MTTLVTGAGLIGTAFAQSALARGEQVVFVDPEPRADFLRMKLGAHISGSPAADTLGELRRCVPHGSLPPCPRCTRACGTALPNLKPALVYLLDDVMWLESQKRGLSLRLVGLNRIG